MIVFPYDAGGSSIVQCVTSEYFRPVLCGNVHTADTHRRSEIDTLSVRRKGYLGDIVIDDVVDS